MFDDNTQVIANLIAASGFTLLAALSFYLASPQQQLLDKTWSATALQLISLGAFILAMFFFMQVLGKPAAVFILFTLLMAICSTLPLLVAYWRKRQGAQP